MNELEQRVAAVVDPASGVALSASAAVVRAERAGGRLDVSVVLGYPLDAAATGALEVAISDALDGAATHVSVKSRIGTHAPQPPLSPSPRVRNIIAIGSGKGGVGKSTTAVNLALALAADGAAVGVLDADVYGPSIPTMLGLSGKPESPDGKAIVPMRVHGIEAMSIGLLVEHDTPMIWRGPMATQALTQLLQQTLWGGEDGLDYLVVDLPPGTGDIQLTLAQKIPVAGALVVTTPQEVATMDARKALAMFAKVHVPVLGLVENMAVHVCSQCGHAEHVFGSGGAALMAERYGVPLLGSLPLELAIREQGDAGVPLVAAAPGSTAAEAYRALARNVVAELDKRPRAPMPIAASLA
jgi:ATP-binding protein involved in chromosome partitioning